MSLVIPNGDPLIKLICEALGLPKFVKSFELRVAVDEVVTVKCEFFLDVDGSKSLPVVTERYELHRIEESKPALDA